MRWLVLAALLVLGGCGSSPKTQFYTLETVGPAGGDPVGTRGPPLQVGHVSLPGELDRAALVTLGPGPAVAVSDHERWAAPLDELVRRTLTDDLRARLGTGAVLAPDDPAPPGGVRTVVLAVQRFAPDNAGKVVLEADWTLAAAHGGRSAGVQHVRVVEDAGSAAGGAVAAAMSRALGVVADRVAAGPAVRP